MWTEEDAAQYDKRWPLGTKERVWRDVLFYTGLRRGDAVTLGRQHVRDGLITMRTEKSQEEMSSAFRSCQSCSGRLMLGRRESWRSSAARTASR